MSKQKEPNYWIFSNKASGAYQNNIWDMSTILATKRYSIKEKEGNSSHIKPGDKASAYFGKCFHPLRFGVSTCFGIAFPLPERSDASL